MLVPVGRTKHAKPTPEEWLDLETVRFRQFQLRARGRCDDKSGLCILRQSCAARCKLRKRAQEVYQRALKHRTGDMGEFLPCRCASASCTRVSQGVRKSLSWRTRSHTSKHTINNTGSIVCISKAVSFSWERQRCGVSGGS